MGYLDNNGLSHLWQKIKAALSGKQDTLTGTQGQVVGFDAEGKAVAQEAPSGGGGEVYSSEETVIGTWIDGKTLYRRVFTVPMPVNNNNTASKEVVLDEYVYIVRIDGVVKTMNAAYEIYPINYTKSSSNQVVKNYDCFYYYDNTNRKHKIHFSFACNIKISTPDQFIIAIIEYTK